MITGNPVAGFLKFLILCNVILCFVSYIAIGSTAAAPAAMVEASLVQETRSFVGAAQTQQLLQRQLFSLFEVLHCTR